MIFSKKNKKYGNTRAGFTLTEFMITMTVFIFLSAAVIANFRSVDDSLVLRNVAHQVAVIIRKAQVFGISSKGINLGAGEVFPNYGVNFRMADDTGFVLFADGNINGVCDPPGTCDTPERVQRYSLASGYKIKDLCANVNTTGAPGCGRPRLNITFDRPNPDGLFKENPGPSPLWADVEIVIQSRTGAIKTIVIWKTGQITIE